MYLFLSILLGTIIIIVALILKMIIIFWLGIGVTLVLIILEKILDNKKNRKKANLKGCYIGKFSGVIFKGYKHEICLEDGYFPLTFIIYELELAEKARSLVNKQVKITYKLEVKKSNELPGEGRVISIEEINER